MESVLVLGGIWAMCALCAVLFIRGASTPDTRRLQIGPDAHRKTSGGTTR